MARKLNLAHSEQSPQLTSGVILDMAQSILSMLLSKADITAQCDGLRCAGAL